MEGKYPWTMNKPLDEFTESAIENIVTTIGGGSSLIDYLITRLRLAEGARDDMLSHLKVQKSWIDTSQKKLAELLKRY